MSLEFDVEMLRSVNSETILKETLTEGLIMPIWKGEDKVWSLPVPLGISLFVVWQLE